MANLALSLPPTAASVGRARRAVRRCCEQWGADEAATESLALLTSEVVTNAVLHARTPVELRAYRNGSRVRVETADTSPWLPRSRRHSVGNATGRGLRLLQTLAAVWGVIPRDCQQGPGKVVWFELALDSGAQPDDEALAAAFLESVDLQGLVETRP